MKGKTWEQDLEKWVKELNNTRIPFSFHLKNAQHLLDALETEFETLGNHASLSYVYYLYSVVENPIGLCYYIDRLNEEYSDIEDQRTDIIILEGRVHALSDHFITLFGNNVLMKIIIISDKYRRKPSFLYNIEELRNLRAILHEYFIKAMKIYPDPNILPVEVRKELFFLCNGPSDPYLYISWCIKEDPDERVCSWFAKFNNPS